ncbi:MAG: response regulator transcription factor [Candidatus Pacebacteria bacterium]|nr:response regulator transcription factor [Candidatus Paceibacterota bacterium]
MPKTHILIAEDDAIIRDGLVDMLESDGYATSVADDGKAALEAFAKGRFDLIILDIMMPEISGYDVCRQIRKSDETTPIVMLTAKSEEIDKVVGLQLGADDYVTKPFGVRELLARIEAVLRRCRRRTAYVDTPTALPEHFQFGEADIDSTTFRGTLRNAEFELSAREMQLIEYFFERPGKVLPRDDILRAVWDLDYVGTTRTLDQHIAQLRKKIEPDPRHPAYLTTVHGIGYRYEG